jgi:hypothetical protein
MAMAGSLEVSERYVKQTERDVETLFGSHDMLWLLKTETTNMKKQHLLINGIVALLVTATGIIGAPDAKAAAGVNYARAFEPLTKMPLKRDQQ